MSISTPFILRPVATLLLTLALVLAGILSFRLLPVSPLPQVDFPYIVVSATMPGTITARPSAPDMIQRPPIIARAM